MSRSARRHSCKSCGADVLTGADRDTAALPVTVDGSPVDNFGEAVAVMTGRKTFDLRPTRGSRGGIVGVQLEERTASRIRNSMRLFAVHAEHRCGQPLPSATAAERPTSWPEPSF